MNRGTPISGNLHIHLQRIVHWRVDDRTVYDASTCHQCLPPFSVADLNPPEAIFDRLLGWLRLAIYPRLYGWIWIPSVDGSVGHLFISQIDKHIITLAKRYLDYVAPTWKNRHSEPSGNLEKKHIQTYENHVPCCLKDGKYLACALAQFASGPW